MIEDWCQQGSFCFDFQCDANNLIWTRGAQLAELKSGNGCNQRVYESNISRARAGTWLVSLPNMLYL